MIGEETNGSLFDTQMWEILPVCQCMLIDEMHLASLLVLENDLLCMSVLVLHKNAFVVSDSFTK